MPADITTTESALLRFPASVPGVLRRGSPVTNTDGTASGVVFGLPGYDATHPDLWGVNWLHVIHRLSSAECFYLDLTDATGRAHLAWWLAVNLPPQALGGRPGNAWGFTSWRRAEGWAAWMLARPNGSGAWFWSAEGSGGGLVVSSLVTLDPNDPRLLPDGSRLVDVLALSLVARHVAGLEVPRD